MNSKLLTLKNFRGGLEPKAQVSIDSTCCTAPFVEFGAYGLGLAWGLHSIVKWPNLGNLQSSTSNWNTRSHPDLAVGNASATGCKAKVQNEATLKL